MHGRMRQPMHMHAARDADGHTYCMRVCVSSYAQSWNTQSVLQSRSMHQRVALQCIDRSPTPLMNYAYTRDEQLGLCIWL